MARPKAQFRLEGGAFDRERALAPQVYALLRARIVDNSLAPGERLSEAALAENLDVSRTPIRAALQQLAGEGLLSVKPQAGTVVAPLDDAAIEEAVFVRAALESAVARRLARRRVPKARFERLMARQSACAENDDYDGFFALDEAFHQALAEEAAAPSAWRLVHGVKGQVDRQRYLLMRSIPGRSLRAHRDHARLLAAIARGDESGAAAIMTGHVHSVLELEP